MSCTTNTVTNAFTNISGLPPASFWDTQVAQMDSDFTVQFLGFYAQEMIKMSQIDDKINKEKQQQQQQEKQEQEQEQGGRDQQPLLHVLDVACGTGLVANMIARKFNKDVQISGIDYSPEMIKKAIEKSKATNLDVNYQVMDGQNLTFSDESFDFLYSLMGVIFYPNLTQGFKEIYRVLKKNGGCAVIAGWTEKLPSQLMTEVLEKVTGKASSLNSESPVFRLKDREVFSKLLEDAGFTSYEIKYVPRVLKVPRDTMIQLLMGVAQATACAQQDEKFIEALNQVVDSHTNENDGICSCESLAVIGIAHK